MNPALSTAVILSLAVSAAAQDRQKAEAVWKEGKVTISYGAPDWRAEFGEAMAKQATWRLGKNDPTTVTLTCGLMTDAGCIPAGSYGMAMQKNDQGKWDLVVYSGSGMFRKGQPGWTIKPASSKAADATAEQLMLALNDDKHLVVKFGPHVSTYPMTPVAMHPVAKAEFAGMPTAVEVMAVPVPDKVANLAVGSASVSGNGMTVAWNMALTIDGDTATLAFASERAAEIAGEKKQIAGMIERFEGALEGADEERKAQMETRIATQKKAMEKLEKEAMALQRFKAAHTVTGEVSKREKPAANLAFESERVEGGMTLVFGAGNRTATFMVKPREFRQRESRQGR